MKRPISWIKATLVSLIAAHFFTESLSFLIRSPNKHRVRQSNCCSSRGLRYSAVALLSLQDDSADEVATIKSEENGLYEQIQTLRKQKQFKHLPDDVVSIIPRSDDPMSQQNYGDDVVPINTIVLQLHTADFMETVLVVISAQDKIDMGKLQSFWKEKRPSVQRVELAPSDQVEALVGYAPGCIPPIGHTVDSKLTIFPTIIEESLIQNTPRRQLLGGGGSEEFRSSIRLPVLVGMDHVEIASIGVGSNMEEQLEAGEKDIVSTLPQRQISLPAWGSTTRPKPLFPLETPDMEQAKALLSVSLEEDLPPVDATWVTMVGKLGSIRRVSKRLVFCDLLPPGFECNEKDGNDVAELVAENPFPAEWRSAVDGKDLSVQLIGGSTLCQAMGEAQGQAALRRLQAGKLVLIQAKLKGYSSRDCLEQWVANRRLELTLVSFQLLDDSVPPTRPQESMPPPSATTPNKPFLQFEDILSDEVMNKNKDSQDFIKIVDDSESLKSFSEHVSVLLDSLAEENPAANGDAATPIASNGETSDQSTPTMKYEMIGLDCEWKPSFYLNTPQERQPVLVLQISIQNRIYIFDMQLLARPFLSVDVQPTAEEKALNDVLERVFSSKNLFKVGFQLVQDLQKLAASYPHLPAFQLVLGVVEASTLATKVIRSNRQRNARLITSSLNRLTEHFLDRSVNKEQQVSDWSQRPLTREQIQYAALDAAVTAALVKQFFETLELFVFAPGPELGRWKGDTSFMKMLTSYKFLFLQLDADFHVIKKLKAKAVISGYPLLVVTQMWTTTEDAPKLPSVPDNDTEGPYTDVFGILQVPSTTVRIRPQSLAVEEQKAFVASLVGQRTGKSKEKCLTTLLSAALSENPRILPEDSRLQYPPRSGYIEFDDGVALFVNMPEKAAGGGQPRSFPNEWLEDGKVLTWFVRDYEWRSGTTYLAKKVLDPDSLVMLFVRVMNKNYFLCCGPCQVHEPKVKTDIVSKEKQERWDLVQLNLKLLEREKLSSSNEFLSLIV